MKWQNEILANFHFLKPCNGTKILPFYPYNYKTGYFNALGNSKKVAFKVARTLDKQLPVTAFNPADAKLWATKTTALACENLVLALRAYGFDSCMMEGLMAFSS